MGSGQPCDPLNNTCIAWLPVKASDRLVACQLWPRRGAVDSPFVLLLMCVVQGSHLGLCLGATPSPYKISALSTNELGDPVSPYQIFSDTRMNSRTWDLGPFLGWAQGSLVVDWVMIRTRSPSFWIREEEEEEGGAGRRCKPLCSASSLKLCELRLSVVSRRVSVVSLSPVNRCLP